MLNRPQNIPTSFGVYKWFDENDRVIYVGKANNLRNRLNNYFAPVEKLHPRTAKMVQLAHRLEWTIVQNETEALTLEYNWIKEFEPRFNVIFRFDDKSYSYLAISKDKFPRVFITRKRNVKNLQFYGPFPKAWAIKHTYDVLQSVLQFRSCSAGVFNSAKRSKTPCLLGYINKCITPCVKQIEISDYAAIVSKLRSFIGGDVKQLEKLLTKQMKELSDKEQFELAITKRDQIESIKVIAQHNSVQFNNCENLDVIAISGDELEMGVCVFKVRHGILTQEQLFVATLGIDQTSADLMNELILELYVNSNSNDNGDDIPREICVSVLPNDYVILKSLLTQLANKVVNLHIASRGLKRDLLCSASKNAKETLAKLRQNRRSDIASRQKAIEEIAASLQLKSQPLRIECYDISHSAGEHQVGAMVVFEEGLPKKKDYRLFNLNGEYNAQWLKLCETDTGLDMSAHKIAKIASRDTTFPLAYIVRDDTAAIYEVLRRRLAHIDEGSDSKFAYTPQLLLIDGGKPQVNAAKRAVRDAGFDGKIDVASIAKRLEEIWLPDVEFPVILPRNSLALFMLQHLRDESHNFSIRSMRRRQKNALIQKKRTKRT